MIRIINEIAELLLQQQNIKIEKNRVNDIGDDDDDEKNDDTSYSALFYAVEKKRYIIVKLILSSLNDIDVNSKHLNKYAQ